jgi:hypothetical protein
MPFSDNKSQRRDAHWGRKKKGQNRGGTERKRHREQKEENRKNRGVSRKNQRERVY